MLGPREALPLKQLLKTSSNSSLLTKSITDRAELKLGVGRGTKKYGEVVKASGELEAAESLGSFLKVKCGFMK